MTEMKETKNLTTKKVVIAAMIAAIYAVLTIVLAPISYGPIQVRLSEALTVLPALTPRGIPGVFVGCIVANIISPYGLVDLVLGSLATLIAAIASYKLKDHPWLVPLPPVISPQYIFGATFPF